MGLGGTIGGTAGGGGRVPGATFTPGAGVIGVIDGLARCPNGG